MISEIFIERPKLAMVISIVIMIGGILCITKVPVAEYPEVTPPQINVSATYPGASAQVIADTVAAPIETEVNGVENMIYFSSQSDNSGNYSLDLTFEPGTGQRAECREPRGTCSAGRSGGAGVEGEKEKRRHARRVRLYGG